MTSVKVFWPDRAALDGHLRQYVSSLLAREEVVDVYLCGSWANETHTVASDVDLLILIKDQPDPAFQKPHDRMPAYLPDSFPTSLDLFVYTVAEARESSFVKHLLQGGIPFPRGEGAASGGNPS